MNDFVDLDVFLPNIQPELDRCPEPVIFMKMREAVIELCEYAPVWQHKGQPIAVRQGVSGYLLDMPHEESEVHSVLGCWFGDRALHPASHNDLRDEPGNRATSTTQGLYEYSVSVRGQITLYGVPAKDEVESLRVTASLKPTREAFELPAFMKSDYFQTIVHGAVGHAMMMTKRSWSDPLLGEWHRRRFNEGKIDARMALDRGLVTGPQRLRSRRFVANRRFV